MTLVDEQLEMDKVSIAEVALNYPQAVDILKAYNLDYCCGGKKSFADACKQAGVEPARVWNEILEAKANHGADSRIRFDAWNGPLLIDFVIQHHHEYVRRSIPEIQQLLEKVCSVHGYDAPNLYTIRDKFSSLADELVQHMYKEETILFPAMLSSFEKRKSGNEPFDLTAPIRVMEHEHDSAGDLIKTIRTLTENYTPPAYACPTFRMTFVMLQQFDDDLMQHIHIENNILFSRVKMKF
jgi:regulator of cell morphogenesis and NO signaling